MRSLREQLQALLDGHVERKFDERKRSDDVGTLHTANHPFSPVVAVRCGTRRVISPRPIDISIHSATTDTPALGDPSLESETAQAQERTPVEVPPSRISTSIKAVETGARFVDIDRAAWLGATTVLTDRR